MKKKLFAIAVLGIAALSVFGCGKKEEATTEATTQTASSEEATTEQDTSHDGLNYNELTGEWSADYVPRRPVAVMINNLKEALPSSSTKQADIIYECMVEGGITRIMPIFSNYENLEKLGSVRSARHYYINIAYEYNAIYVHYGQSKPAEDTLAHGLTDNINGLTYDAGFYRDSARVAPHNAYTTGERIVQGIKDMGYSTEYSADHQKVFSFHETEQELDSQDTADTIHVNFSSYSKPYFVYNEDTKLYDRYEYGEPQVDDQADPEDNVLNFKNVIIQISKYTCINPDNDLQDLQQLGQGKGYYCTDGKVIPVTWKKASHAEPTKFYTEDGEELLLNPGKTWVSIIGDGKDAGVSFE